MTMQISNSMVEVEPKGHKGSSSILAKLKNVSKANIYTAKFKVMQQGLKLQDIEVADSYKLKIELYDVDDDTITFSSLGSIVPMTDSIILTQLAPPPI